MQKEKQILQSEKFLKFPLTYEKRPGQLVINLWRDKIIEW